MIPYADIIGKADRRWTARLMARLEATDLPEDELDELFTALQIVADPRSFASLESILIDTSMPARIRDAASSILRGTSFVTVEVPEETLRRWWRTGDTLLRRHALLCMDRVDCPEIVLQVASDPAHEFHAEALGMMVLFFELPQHQQLKIAALSHPDARVREVGAGLPLWDEPVAAEFPLIEATSDSVPQVAAEAANTLEYYPSMRTIRCLHGLLKHADETVREEARNSLQSIRHEILLQIRFAERHAADHIREWLEPVWSLLAFTEEELHPKIEESQPSQTKTNEAMPLADVIAALSDPDTSPKALEDLFWSNDWQSYTEEERRQMTPLLLKHSDQLVREKSALCFAAWQDAAALAELVRDPVVSVHKQAMYRLSLLPQASWIADLAWEYLQRHDVLGFHASETLETFVNHSLPNVAIQRLGLIAGDHGQSENLRVTAVYHLAELEAVEAVEQLVGLLQEPPAVTWAFHIALLDAFAILNLPSPKIDHLREVDNLHVQVALASFPRTHNSLSPMS